MPADSALLAYATGRARAELLRRKPELTDRQKLLAYARDPAGFSSHVLTTNLWAGQLAMLQAVLDGATQIAVCSGQKIGKTTMFAVAALWLYSQGWRVFATTPTEHQLNGAFWREVRRLVMRATVPIPGAKQIHTSARGGLHDPETLAHIVGLLGRDVEALQGMSGSKMAFLVDEASGVDDGLIEAIKGNMMGGGLLLMAGNPTRTTGEFFEAFTRKKSSYRTFEISSLDVPSGSDAIPGLADRAWCEARKEEYGEDSPFYQVRVLGKFVVGEEGKCMPLALIERCHEQWDEAQLSEGASIYLPQIPKRGLSAEAHVYLLRQLIAQHHDPARQLVIGLDPAGDSGEGDESIFTIRLIAGIPVGLPVIMLDREGQIGERIFRVARVELEREARVIGVRASAPAVRQPLIYARRRDELWAAMGDSARKGELPLPRDAKLDSELNAFSFEQMIGGKFKVTDKREIRKALGRSPDRADSAALANWWIPSLPGAEMAMASVTTDPEDMLRDMVFDSGEEWWK